MAQKGRHVPQITWSPTAPNAPPIVFFEHDQRRIFAAFGLGHFFFFLET